MAQQAGEVRQRLRALGELEAAPKGALGLVALLEALQHVAEVVPDAGAFRRHLDGAAQQGERGGVLAALVLQDAHVVEDVGMIRPALEQDRVDRLRVVEPVDLVALDGERQRLLRA